MPMHTLAIIAGISFVGAAFVFAALLCIEQAVERFFEGFGE